MHEITFVRTDGKGAVTVRYPPTKKYVAISYRWGKGLPSWELQTRDYVATVSAFYQQHFSILLNWVKTELGIPYVWIDAICIDQNCATDKARQLGEMTRLFHNAEAVIAAPWLAQPHHADIIQMYGDWTSRCWVAAEIHSAKVIYYTRWNWSEGWMWCDKSRPDKEGFCPPGADPAAMSQEEEEEHRRMSDHVVMLRKGRLFGRFHVDEIAKIAVELKATKESDKLYALMPMTGTKVPRGDVQMDLGEFVMYLIKSLASIDQMRLVMGVSRFKEGHSSNMSWAFGPGAEYRAPWANNEYLAKIWRGSVVELNGDWSLTIDAPYHAFKLNRGVATTNSEFYGTSCDACIGKYLFYHPQIDGYSADLVLISCGLDYRERVVGIMVDCESREKIGIFMLERQSVAWERGPNNVR